MWPRIPPHSLTTFELVPDLPLGWILVFLFYFIFPFLIVCRSLRGTSSFLFYFTILFSSHCRASRAICSDFTTFSCAVFDSSLTHICSCAVNGISIKCAICLCPRGATLLILQSSIPPIPHIASHAREPTYNPSMFRFPSLCSLPSPYIRLHHFHASAPRPSTQQAPSMLPSAPTSARINLPNTATGFDLLDSCTILAAHIPGTTSSCTLSRLGLPHCSFTSSLRLVV